MFKLLKEKIKILLNSINADTHPLKGKTRVPVKIDELGTGIMNLDCISLKIWPKYFLTRGLVGRASDIHARAHGFESHSGEAAQ